MLSLIFVGVFCQVSLRHSMPPDLVGSLVELIIPRFLCTASMFFSKLAKAYLSAAKRVFRH